MENKIKFASMLVMLFFTLFTHSAWGQETGKIQLDADKISFEESSGVAEAEGDVRISNEEMSLFAPFAKYDSDGQQLSAYSSPEKPVVLISGGRQLNGESIHYNLLTKRGTMTKPNGKVDELYVKGDVVQVVPVSEVLKRKSGTGNAEDELAGRWLKTSVTTCNEPEPHYRLETKELVVVPGKRVVIKKPRIYIGRRLLYTNPFDIVLPAKNSSKQGKVRFLPKLEFEESKGAGVGISVPYVWDSGSINMDVVGWTKGIWEGELSFNQEISAGLSAWARLKREYDKDRELTLWRPQAGFNYSSNGWDVNAIWSQREIVSVRKRSGTDSRYVIWRKPEVSVSSPWLKDEASGVGYYRLMGVWGRYEDATKGGSAEVERLGAGAQIYGEFKDTKNFTPFYNATYWYYRYNSDMYENHQTLNAILGVRWGLGAVALETAYLRRWAWGRSPMEWDNYEPLEEVYQQIGVKIPTASRKTFWELKARGAYSLTDDKLSEMVYKVIYDQHCLQWELIYRDDLIAADDWVGLKLTINAYPEHEARLMGEELFDPMKSPDKLPTEQ